MEKIKDLMNIRPCVYERTVEELYWTVTSESQRAVRGKWRTGGGAAFVCVRSSSTVLYWVLCRCCCRQVLFLLPLFDDGFRDCWYRYRSALGACRKKSAEEDDRL